MLKYSRFIPRVTKLAKPIRRFHSLPLSKSFVFSPEVKHALNEGSPVVALESTIISHGMPYPENVQTARAVENIVRDNEAIPATIALLNGKVHIGLEEEELEQLGKYGSSAMKTSSRDLAYVMSQRLTGATTVASTMILARAAGIPVFVTGGIGGVHRGAEETMDISADLMELGRTPVAVVCAGAKSILDLEKTLEVLETQGVTVATLGKTDQFPAFYTENSGFKSPCQLPDPLSAAKLIQANHQLELNSGIIIAVPIPAEHAADGDLIQRSIDQALRDARERNIRGKDETPFLLKRIAELTEGASLTANIHLVKNNAKVGSQIAVNLANLKKNL